MYAKKIFVKDEEEVPYDLKYEKDANFRRQRLQTMKKSFSILFLIYQ